MNYDPNLIRPESTLNMIIKDNLPPNLTNQGILDYQAAERDIRDIAVSKTATGTTSTLSAGAAYYTPPAGPIPIATKLVLGGVA